MFNACVKGGKRLEETCPDNKRLIVRPGDRLSVHAWSKIRPDNSLFSVGPNGTNAPEHRYKKIFQQHAYASLLCKTKNERNWRLCGTRAYGSVKTGGQLQFLVNDKNQQDNSKEFKISVAINGHLYAGEVPPWAKFDIGDKQWYGTFKKLPHCYCYAGDIPTSGTVSTKFGEGTWSSEFAGVKYIDLSRKGHPGGEYDYRFRWTWKNPKLWRDKDVRAGQQCIYDRYGKLITAGWGAGTPDIVSPLSSVVFGHKSKDEKPFKSMPIDVYLKRWPPNKGRRGAGEGGTPGRDVCPSNVVPANSFEPRLFGHLKGFD